MFLFETSHLRIRPLEAGDAPFILRLLNEPSFLHWIGDRGVRNLEQAIAYIEKGPLASYAEHGFGLELVEERESGAPVGICGLLKRPTLDDPDLGFAFVPEGWGKGYAVESAGAVVAWADRELRLPRVVAITSPDHVRSIRVLEKLGFEFRRMVRLAEGEPEVRLFERSNGGTGRGGPRHRDRGKRAAPRT